MAEFCVQFTETIQYEITIEADSKKDAEAKIRSLDYQEEEASQLGMGGVDIDNIYEV